VLKGQQAPLVLKARRVKLDLKVQQALQALQALTVQMAVMARMAPLPLLLLARFQLGQRVQAQR